VKNGNLSTAVRSFELIKGDGDVIDVLPGQTDDWFNGGVVGLGGLGVISSLKLAIQKSFPMRQRVYQNLPLEELKNNFVAILSSGYSVSLFTDWLNNEVSQVWIKSKSGQAGEVSSKEFYGAKAATKNLHPIVALGAENCTEQLGIDGPWYERMPHFKMGFTPSSGEELQAEYFVPFENGLEAMLAIEKQKEKIYPLLLISEIRTIAADSFWMSPCFQQPCLSIHFTLKPDWEGVKKLLPIIERELEPFRVKPHWGKLFTIPSNVLASRYEKMPDFIKMIKSIDPGGKFRNDFLDTYIYSNE
ncbi:MAG: D-arabinono-1,4-lactone oxidase, partial [Saprospiraceae bacterium]|nr:D-arabinono-1,4-lactone oxidase [Saprospiraceae bacterium]